MQDALRGERDAEVPCDGCTACCTSGQFVHIGPDETETLARIPRQLLFPAPRMPTGHVVLGYDEHGRCPMLAESGCSIYEHRPRACRTYDCRVFPAAGLEADKPAIAERAGRWRFELATDRDRTEHEAVQAAAAFLEERAGLVGDGPAPANPTQLAVLAVEVHTAFLGQDARTGDPTLVAPDVDDVRAALARRAAG